MYCKIRIRIQLGLNYHCSGFAIKLLSLQEKFSRYGSEVGRHLRFYQG